MKLMRAFTKKGYYCGRKYLVFKSYGNKVQGVLQSPALEDEDGYIVHSTYTTSIVPAEQYEQLIRSFNLTGMGHVPYRVFNEEGIPYDDIF